MMQIDIDAHFGEVLKVQRKIRKLSQRDLAKKAEINRTYVSMLERGVRKPSLEVAMNIAKVLEIPASEMVSEVESLVSISENT